jgi:hypothetical protein
VQGFTIHYENLNARRRVLGDNAYIVRCIVGGIDVHTQLKGRIFSTEGVSYLVLQEETESPDWLRVKALNPRQEVRRMSIEEVRRCLSSPPKA